MAKARFSMGTSRGDRIGA